MTLLIFFFSLTLQHNTSFSLFASSLLSTYYVNTSTAAIPTPIISDITCSCKSAKHHQWAQMMAIHCLGSSVSFFVHFFQLYISQLMYFYLRSVLLCYHQNSIINDNVNNDSNQQQQQLNVSPNDRLLPFGLQVCYLFCLFCTLLIIIYRYE